MQPEELATELSVDAVQLRAWLLDNYANSDEEADESWTLTDEQVAAVRERFATQGDVEELDRSEPWDEFVEWARRFYTSPDFDSMERDYKLNLGRGIAAARSALQGGEDWFSALSGALKSRDNNITRFNQRDSLLGWLEAEPEEGRRALSAIWDNDAGVGDQVAGFMRVFPKAALGGRGMRTTIASLLLLGVDPTQTPPYKPEHFHDAYRITGYPPLLGGDEADEYLHALAFLDRVTEECAARGLHMRDRLDAQGVVWAVLKNELPTPATEEHRHLLARYRGEVPVTWWVNQGQSYTEERSAGYVFAPLVDKRGRELAHWANVSRLRPGDIVLHYADRLVQAISRVERKATVAPRPNQPDQPNGWLARVDYHDLDNPIPLTEIPEGWRVQEGGVFNVNGGVKQAYMFPLGEKFAENVKETFADRWPSQSPWGRTPGHWLFQANPKFYDLAAELASTSVGEDDDWTVTKFHEEYAAGDKVVLWQSGPNAGIYALGEVTGNLFERDEDPWRANPGDGPYYALPFRYTQILRKPILKRDIADHPLLASLSVILAPQGTNFRVNPAQYRAILELTDGPPIVTAKPATEFETIRDAVAAAGMLIDTRDLRRFHTSLITGGFVILSGISGTGKTWLAELYAEAVGAEFLLVPVAPNWTTNEDLLGWHNPLSDQYQHTVFSRFLMDSAEEYERAEKEGRPAKQCVLLLDEMNLARVEYYFAKFLSAMEVRRRNNMATLPLSDTLTTQLYDNLWFVGTVNIDETTHVFADKVYDRAQLVELTVDRSRIETRLGEAPHKAAMLEVWDAVALAKPFAFRIVDEAQRYIDQVQTDGGTWKEALDDIILQKVLPKLSGSDSEVGSALQTLADLTEEQYPLSHDKAIRMRDDYQAHGFASYF